MNLVYSVIQGIICDRSKMLKKGLKITKFLLKYGDCEKSVDKNPIYPVIQWIFQR
jgi:hypothetical protein